jgi:ATP-dependent RNA helicase DeaD
MAPTSERRQPQRGGPRRPAKSKNTGPKGPPPEELKPILDPPPIEKFTEWPLDERIQRAIANMDIVTPTPVQKLAIGPVLEGKDVIAKAETGTGKTLAFGAPMISKMDVERSTVLGLVLCPTRELAQQVARVLESLALEKGLNVALLVGGDPIPPQIKQLQKGCQVVVGTPGRVLDLYKQRFLKFPWTEFVVLDEADEMLEIGFLDDVEKIISFTPEERQTLLFSATFPPALLSLARKHTQNPVEIATAKGVATVDRIQQSMAYVKEDDVAFVLRRLIQDSSKDDLFLVFGERRTDVDAARRLRSSGALPCDGRLPQERGARADRHRRGLPRPRRERRDPRDQCRPAPRGLDLHPPHRPHRPRGQVRSRPDPRDPHEPQALAGPARADELGGHGDRRPRHQARDVQEAQRARPGARGRRR